MLERTSGSFVEQDAIEWEASHEGVRRKVLGYHNNLMMVLVQFDKDATGFVHRHFHTQATYVVSGSFEVHVGGKRQILKAGDCFVAPPQTEHGVCALEKSSLLDVFTPIREDLLPHLD